MATQATEWNEYWPKSDKAVEALRRLDEMGVEVRTSRERGEASYDLCVDKPSIEFPDEAWIELGYLVAQLSSGLYPRDFRAKMKERGGRVVCIYDVLDRRVTPDGLYLYIKWQSPAERTPEPGPQSDSLLASAGKWMRGLLQPDAQPPRRWAELRAERMEEAVRRLKELGIERRAMADPDGSNGRVELHAPADRQRSAMNWIEVGYLTAQLWERKYPRAFRAGPPDSGRPVGIFGGAGTPSPIRVRNTPEGLWLTMLGSVADDEARLLAALRSAAAHATPVEVAESLSKLVGEPLSQSLLMFTFKRAFPAMPLNVLFEAREWRRVGLGKMSDEEFNRLLGPWLRPEPEAKRTPLAMTPAKQPIEPPLYELGGMRVGEMNLTALFGAPHFVENDSARTFGGSEEHWGFVLSSGQVFVLVFQVPYKVAVLYANPPEIEPIVAIFGLPRSDPRFDFYPTPVFRTWDPRRKNRS